MIIECMLFSTAAAHNLEYSLENAILFVVDSWIVSYSDCPAPDSTVY